MRITGAEFMDWYDNGFPAGHFHESDDYYNPDVPTTHKEDGSWALDPLRVYDTADLGEIYPDSEDIPSKVWSMDASIKAWRKAKTHQTLIVDAPKDKVDEIKAFLKAVGAKVL